MGVFIVALVIGLIPAAIAHSKGRGFFGWWIYGALLFIVALPHAILLKVDQSQIDRRQLEDHAYRKCPHCAEVVKAEARVCKHCGRDILAPQAS